MWAEVSGLPPRGGLSCAAWVKGLQDLTAAAGHLRPWPDPSPHEALQVDIDTVEKFESLRATEKQYFVDMVQKCKDSGALLANP